MIKAILFDWGDTVMRVLPQFHGAMADWPKVEAIPGIRDACENLVQDYELYLATNASKSGPDKVRAALARVKLDQYFTRIFTAHDLGCSKPSRSFFDTILTTLALSPDEVLHGWGRFPIGCAWFSQCWHPVDLVHTRRIARDPEYSHPKC